MSRRCAPLLFVIALAAIAAASVPAEAPLADAALQPDVHLNWDQTSIQSLNAKRAQLSLDVIWRFTPAAGGPLPEAGWGYIRVPGDRQDHPNRPSSLVAPGGGLQWQPYAGSLVTRAWYERQVTIPAEWQGRAISLRLDRVSTDAIVSVNGTECGRVAWPWGSVDYITGMRGDHPKYR
jgi:beta-galactosidase